MSPPTPSRCTAESASPGSIRRTSITSAPLPTLYCWVAPRSTGIGWPRWCWTVPPSIGCLGWLTAPRSDSAPPGEPEGARAPHQRRPNSLCVLDAAHLDNEGEEVAACVSLRPSAKDSRDASVDMSIDEAEEL